MTTISRRAFARGTVAAGAAIGTFSILKRPAHAAEFVYKFGHNMPVTHPLNIRMQEILPKIQEESNGRLELRVFPNGQLGGDTDMLSQLRSGGLDMFTASGVGLLSTLSKPISLYGIAFAFPDHDRLWAALDGEMGAHLRGLISKLGLHAFDKVWDNGFRQITSGSRPITTPQDLKGFKIRVPVSPLWTSCFQALGAAPTGINFNEVYSALQTHIVDGQENPLALISTAKLYEVQKYCSMTNHMYDGWFCLVNGRAWKSLPPDLQNVLERNVNGAAVRQREDLVKLNQTVEEDLKKGGLIFNRIDPAPFREALSKAGFYKQWRETYGNEAWALLEKYAGPLA